VIKVRASVLAFFFVKFQTRIKVSKLDSKKELLNTLRTSFGVIIALILTVTAGLINLYYKGNVDFLFYIGIIFDIMLVFILPIIVRYIVTNIKEIEEL